MSRNIGAGIIKTHNLIIFCNECKLAQDLNPYDFGICDLDLLKLLDNLLFLPI